ncbi:MULTISPECIES: prepilin peptidase [Bifidobacterium]|uniref:prepilin peptidase n=1 Tax=Bifidobacterium TaxID=1678 RepID=UPI001BDC6184|nr:MULTISPECIES: prepilin peptidase [Bifidobacterium]MBT1161328.1 prepilin peptidase [Bifidobacterium sp. SO1]MBW3078374.1 prepilin peptidase [Bifidobacterium simiiventris]
MPYLALLPSLICGLAVSVEDVRHRRVPRAWIAVGVLTQLAANVVYALAINSLFVAVQALLFAAVAAVLQCLLALAKPGALGFGDVTCTLAVGLGVGLLGLTAMVIWWLAMGLVGLAWMTIWIRFDPQSDTPYAGKVPFAPVIVIAGLLAACAASLI